MIVRSFHAGFFNSLLAIAIGEWICERFSLVSQDPAPFQFLEAAWAGAIYPPYCLFTETVDDEWRGPVRGPLAVTIVIVNDALFHLRDDPHVATRVCWMLGLARHVLPSTRAFESWLEACLIRLEQLYTKPLEGKVDADPTSLFDDFPGQGEPVPREAYSPETPYDPLNAPHMLDVFLRSLDVRTNRYLRSAQELDQYGDLSGPAYSYPH